MKAPFRAPILLPFHYSRATGLIRRLHRDTVFTGISYRAERALINFTCSGAARASATGSATTNWAIYGRLLPTRYAYRVIIGLVAPRFLFDLRGIGGAGRLTPYGPTPIRQCSR